MADDEEMEGPVAAQAERELDEETRLASKATTVPEVGEDGGTASGAADDAGGEASIEHAREASDSSELRPQRRKLEIDAALRRSDCCR